MTVPIKVGDKIIIGSSNAAIERMLDTKYQRTHPKRLEWDTTKPVAPPELTPLVPPEKPAPQPMRDLREDEKPKAKKKKKKNASD